MSRTDPIRVGVLSDTHGLLRPEVLSALVGVDHILHAGDVGNPDILRSLESIAPVTAIRGNIDRSGACATLPATEAIELGGHLLYLVHALPDLDLNPQIARISAVIYGHSHKPSIAWKNEVLYLNAGSVGPRRFALPISLALLHIEGPILRPELITLHPST